MTRTIQTLLFLVGVCGLVLLFNFVERAGNTSEPFLIASYDDGSMYAVRASLELGDAYTINWISKSGTQVLGYGKGQIPIHGRGPEGSIWFIENTDASESRHIRLTLADGSQQVLHCESAAEALVEIARLLSDNQMARISTVPKHNQSLAQQAISEQPAARCELDFEDSDKPQPESEGSSR